MASQNQFACEDVSKLSLLRDDRETDNGDDAQGIEDAKKSPQLSVSPLQNELRKLYAEIFRLQTKINHYKNIGNFDQEENDIINQRNELLKLLSIKDNTIERMSSDIRMLEQQLKVAVSEKFDALARLDAFEVKELTTLFKKKQTEMIDGHAKSTKQNVTMNEKTLAQNEVDVDSQRKQQGADDTINRSSNERKRSRNDTSVLTSPGRDDDMAEVERSTSSAFDQDIITDGSYKETSPSNQANNIQLELLSEVRTRRQNQFLLDAFNGSSCNNASDSATEELITRNDKKVRVQKQPKFFN